MRTSHLTASFSALSALLAIACSSSSGSSVSNDQAAADVAKAFCQIYDSCADPYIQITYGNEPACEARFKIAVVPTLAANGTGATAGQYESCSADLAKTSCDDLLSRNLPKSCQTVAGTLADGTACGADAQCQGRLCRLANNSNCGACSSIVAAGGACDTDGECDVGLACANKVCTAYGASGASCDANHPCKLTLTCNSGTCGAPAEAGAACPGIGQAGCDTLKGLFCNTSSVCASFTVVAAGQPCGLVTNNSYALCSDAGICKGASGLTPGTCTAAAVDGASCDETNGPACVSPAICTGGVCKVPDPSTCK
ncbi:MAG: hypothetical protein ACRELY_26995 [Polyangiaceae bacterium]